MKKWNGNPPARPEVVPVTAEQLRQRMESLLARVAPRVLSDARLPTGRTPFSRIEPMVLVNELQRWNSDN